MKSIFILLTFTVYTLSISANTVSFLHKSSHKVKLSDAAYPTALIIKAQFEYPESTVFNINEDKIYHFYTLNYRNQDYFLWIENLSHDIEIDLERISKQSGYLLLLKQEWYKKDFSDQSTELNRIHTLDVYYKFAVDSLLKLANNNDDYRTDNSYGTIVWDKNSAKKLFNYAIENFDSTIEDEYIHFVPSYIEYWHLLYKLYYQYFHTTSFKGLDNPRVKAQIEKDFSLPESKLLTFHHFFNSTLTESDLKANLRLYESKLSPREIEIAESLIQKKAIQNTILNSEIDFIFGLDIDDALKAYLLRDGNEKKSLLIFWSTWDRGMNSEFSLLNEIKDEFDQTYNFIHLCIDAYEQPEKTKSFVYQNNISGHHLFPQEEKAFRNSIYRKSLKIREFPFYSIVDQNGEILESESIPLSVSNRLGNKLKYYSKK
ncbi:thioredoxin-like domain-containing protein [Marivirga arenosa]|uniref:Thioredoxin-like domain-containing protein n=1 Tax=Marivirga arenosa TaxID=3059076 RepID=A0AA49JI50_9BACT|nr:thioredoxin-like domain-containing protein [Marivirga sp. ABR2-2]WKK85913.2 thioredoxin-like domain-containing protein [Marivirga sp. ABR2-2]